MIQTRIEINETENDKTIEKNQLNSKLVPRKYHYY